MPTKGVRQINLGKLTWIDVQAPSLKLLEKMKNEHGFHDLDVQDCLSDNQRSKIDEYDSYLFIILHFPFYDKRRNLVVSEEIDIFISNNLLLTVHNGTFKPFLDLYEDCQKSPSEKKRIMGPGSGFLLYEIIDQMYGSSFPILDRLEKSVAGLERTVFSWGQQKDMLRDILNTKKNIITMRRVIQPQRRVVAQIEHKNKKFIPESLEIYFDDVVDKIEKSWSSLENLKELIESVQDTNESIISHRTNEVIQILTIFSVVISPLTFLTGLYGMNIGLPFSDNPYMFIGMVGVMTVMITSMLVFFKHKRWL
ncbi:MAG: magnesium transporter [Oceanicoccus sp.]|jgi:magnesium transporter